MADHIILEEGQESPVLRFYNTIPQLNDAKMSLQYKINNLLYLFQVENEVTIESVSIEKDLNIDSRGLSGFDTKIKIVL